MGDRLRVLLSLATAPVALAALTVPWRILPWWCAALPIGFGAFALLVPADLAFAGFLGLLPLLGNPALKGGPTLYSLADPLVAIVVLRCAFAPASPERGQADTRGAVRMARVRAGLWALLAACGASWVVAAAREHDVLSRRFWSELLRVAPRLGTLGDQADPYFGLRRLLDVHEAVVIGVTATVVMAAARARSRALTAVAISVALVVLLAWGQRFTGFAELPFFQKMPGNEWVQVRRIHATFPDANALAAFLVLVGPLLSTVAWERWRGSLGPDVVRVRRRVAFAVTMVVAGAALLLTVSRAALLAVAAEALGVLAFRWAPRRVLIVAGSLVIAGVTFVSVAPRWIPKDLVESNPILLRFVRLSGADVHRSISLGGRVAAWRNAFQLWESEPWFGIGTGQLFRQMPDAWKAVRDPSKSHLRNPHNYVLQLLTESGVFAATAFLALYASAAGWLLGAGRLPRAAVDPWRALGIGLLGYAVMLLLGHPLLQLEQLLWVFCILGVAGIAPGATVLEAESARIGRAERVGVLARRGWVVLGVVAWVVTLGPRLAHPPVLAVYDAYPSEWDPTGRSFRWLRSPSRWVVDGTRGHSLAAKVSAAQPDLSSRPLRVEARWGATLVGHVELSSGEIASLDLELPVEAGRASELEIQCDRTFRPCDVWPTPDCRDLCVRLWDLDRASVTEGR